MEHPWLIQAVLSASVLWIRAAAESAEAYRKLTDVAIKARLSGMDVTDDGHCSEP